MKKYLICILWASVCLSLNVHAQEKKGKLSAQERLVKEYYMMADSCLNYDNYDDAIMYANKGIGEIKNIRKFKERYCELKEIEALSYMGQGEFKSTLSILSQLEQLQLDPWYLAKIYFTESICFYEIEDWSQVISSSQKCLSIIEEWEDARELILDTKLRIARAYAQCNQYDISNDYYTDILEFIKQWFDKEDYIECCAEIYSVFFNRWFSTTILEAISELVTFSEQNNLIDEEYCTLLLEQGMNAQQLGMFQLAYDIYNKALTAYNSLAEKHFYDNYSHEYNIYSNLASVASRLQRYNEAYDYLDKSEKSLITHSETLYDWYKCQLSFERATIMIDEGLYIDKAIEILEALLESERANNNQGWKGSLYYNLGVARETNHIGESLETYNPDMALEAYLTSLPFLSNDMGQGVVYAKALNRIAGLLHNKNDLKSSIEYFELAIELFRKYSSPNNYSFVITLCSAAQCAYNAGEIGRAIAWGEEARRIQKTTDVGYVDFRAWGILLEAYERVNNKGSYDIVYNEYRQYSNNGLSELNFAERELERLCSLGNIEEAVEYMGVIDSLFRSPLLLKEFNVNLDRFIMPEHNYRFDHCMKSWQTRNSSWSLFNFAQWLRYKGEYNSAHAVLKSIYDIFKGHPEYIMESINVSTTCGDIEYCYNIINNSVAVFRNQLKSVIGMSSLEKETYWNDMSYLKNVIAYCRNIIPISKQLYNISLIYKNFLINSQVTFLRTLEQKGNEKQKQIASELRHTKHLLSTVETHNYNVDSLKIREIEINRQIVQNLTNLSDFEYASNICCDSIAMALGANEVAIEIADYSTDENKYYVAMLLRKDWQEPVMIELGDESKFLSLSNKPVKKLYDPTLPFSTELYELIWAPLTPYLNKSDIIYISPSGIISTLAIEALSSEDGMYVSDIYDIKRVSSTAYVLERENEYKYTSSCVFGGVQYDSKVNTNYITENCTWDSGYLLDRSVYEDIPYLPGTKKEAEMISGILANAKNDVSLHIGSEANEYAFKNLSGNASEIIHIATHGFYIPKKEINSYRYYADNTASLAMERSGLMLAGANDAWNGILTPGVEDGILTASEIADLDLSKTSLVVMSACETGLGEVTEDGIQGLQRAFKSAGVETLVMSLWKVDDKATEMLMEEFYKLVLKGYSKDDAFQIAKTKVRSKKSYSSPYYWASFIMLD